jgi:hypothetical protein
MNMKHVQIELFEHQNITGRHYEVARMPHSASDCPPLVMPPPAQDRRKLAKAPPLVIGWRLGMGSLGAK